MKKLVLAAVSVVVLVLVSGGFFYWQNQADVRALNKTLPEGVKIAKSLIGNEYRVVNKKDGYEFKIPPNMTDLKEVKYYEEKDSNGISLESLNDGVLGFGVYKIDATDINLESWVDDWISKFKTYSWTKEKGVIGDFEVIKLNENEHLAGVFNYFFKKGPRIYSVNSLSEDPIDYVISNGKW